MSSPEVTQQAKMFALVAEMHAIEASVEGMKSTNTTHEQQGFALPWGAECFTDAQRELEIIAKRLREEF